MVDHVEAGTVDYIDDLDPAIPQESGTQVAYANDNLRNIKKAVQQSFPNVAGAVTADHTELGYVDGVTSAIQTQLNNLKNGILDDLAVDTDLLIADTGNSRIGLNQATPTHDLHVGDDAGTNNVTVRIESGAASGISQIFLGDAAASNSRIVHNNIGDVLDIRQNALNRITLTSTEVIANDPGNSYDFRVESSGDDYMFFVDGTNDGVGIGQDTPSHSLHVGDDGATNNTTVRIESGATSGISQIFLGDAAASNSRIIHDNDGDTLKIRQEAFDRISMTSTEVIINDEERDYDFRIKSDTLNDLLFCDAGNSRVGIGTDTPAGLFDVNGSIYQRGVQIHADYVFDPCYDMPSIEEHSSRMWADQRLPGMPESMVDDDGQDMIELGQSHRGIVEELELAHVYIEELHERISQLERKAA